jgi:hypothetical protein
MSSIPANSNFLSPTGFKLQIEKLPTVTFFAQDVILPGLTGGVAIQSTPVIDAHVPGDKLIYSDLQLTFLIDEDLANYNEIFSWCQGLYHPESLDQYAAYHQAESTRLIGRYSPRNHHTMVSDAALEILTNNNTSNKTIRFVDLFPISLGSMHFSTTVTDIIYLQCEATFKYTGFSFD